MFQPRIIFFAILSVWMLAACTVTEEGAEDGNAAPQIVSINPTQTAVVGFDFEYDATQAGGAFTDPEGDALSYAVSFAPDNGDFSAIDGVISGMPMSADPVLVTVQASDAGGASVSDSFTISVGVDQDAVMAAFNGAIDLENLDNYANPTVPDYITKRNPAIETITDTGATLGRVLFYDKTLSIDDTVSCATCHKQEIAFGDHIDYSLGVTDKETPRHSSRLINLLYADETNFFWNERAASLEAQASEPLRAHDEHGFSGQDGRPDFDDLIAKMEAIAYYQELFRFVFGDPAITEARIQAALAQFVGSIVSFDSRWDEGRALVSSEDDPFPNFSPSENAGKTLFSLTPSEGGAGCAACHRPPEFDIDPAAGHNGVVTKIDNLSEFDFENTRAPSLRDLFGRDPRTSKGPFMHDGQFVTLRAVIDHYNIVEKPFAADITTFMTSLDSRLQLGGLPQRLDLTEQEKQDLEAYLMTLGGLNVYTDEKWSSPFP